MEQLCGRVYSKTDRIRNDRYFIGLALTCSLYSRKECFLSLLSQQPELSKNLVPRLPLMSVGFLATFNDEEKKQISKSLKLVSPTILFLARKKELLFEKLSPEQRTLAYDCCSEEQLPLLTDPIIRRWARYRLQLLEGKSIRLCLSIYHNVHFDPVNRVLIHLNEMIKKNNITCQLTYANTEECCLCFDSAEDCWIDDQGQTLAKNQLSDPKLQ